MALSPLRLAVGLLAILGELSGDYRVPGLLANQGRPYGYSSIRPRSTPSKPTDGNYRAVVRDAPGEAFFPPPRDRQAEDRCGEDFVRRRALYRARLCGQTSRYVGKTITLPIAVSDPFDQLYKGVIPKEVDALTWSQVAMVRAAAEPRRGGRGRADAPSLKLDVYVDPAKIEAGPPPSGDFAALARDSLQAYFPDVHDTGSVHHAAPTTRREAIAASSWPPIPNLIGKTAQVVFPVSPPYADAGQGRDADGPQSTLHPAADGGLRRP